MTINQGSGVSKKSGIIRKVLSLEGFAVFQVYFYLKRLMRLQSDICVPFTPPEPGWPGTDALMRDELKAATGGCVMRDQGQAAATGQHKDVISPRAAFEVLCYAKSLQSCPTLCDPIDGSLPGSPVPWILQARTLEWVAISFSNA